MAVCPGRTAAHAQAAKLAEVLTAMLADYIIQNGGNEDRNTAAARTVLREVRMNGTRDHANILSRMEAGSIRDNVGCIESTQDKQRQSDEAPLSDDASQIARLTAELEQAKQELATIAAANKGADPCAWERLKDHAVRADARADAALRERDRALTELAAERKRAEKSYVPQDIALDLCRTLEAVGMGKPGSANTVWAMTHEVVGCLQASRAQTDKLARLLGRIWSSCNDSQETSHLPKDIMQSLEAALKEMQP